PARGLLAYYYTLALGLKLGDPDVFDPILNVFQKTGLPFVRRADPWIAPEIGQKCRSLRHGLDLVDPLVDLVNNRTRSRDRNHRREPSRQIHGVAGLLH